MAYIRFILLVISLGFIGNLLHSIQQFQDIIHKISREKRAYKEMLQVEKDLHEKTKARLDK